MTGDQFLGQVSILHVAWDRLLYLVAGKRSGSTSLDLFWGRLLLECCTDISFQSESFLL